MKTIILLSALLIITSITTVYSYVDYSDYNYPDWVKTEKPRDFTFVGRHTEAMLPLTNDEIHKGFIDDCTPQRLGNAKSGVTYYTRADVFESCINTMIDAKLAPIYRELRNDS